MAKKKPSATILVADGAGGMRPVEDLRFDTDPWPVEMLIPSADAEAWMAHLAAERDERGWGGSGLAQLDAAQNSGTIYLYASAGPTAPALEIAWNRVRGARLMVRARSGGTPPLPLDVLHDFMGAVGERVQNRVIDRAYRWEMLTYEGLPWRGELWLEDELRLGPPSQFAECTNEPQVVIVAAMQDGIGHDGIRANFERRVRELRIFLGVVVGIDTTPVRCKRAWVTQFDEQRRATACTLQSVQYWEFHPPLALPARGSCAPVPREVVQRPGIGRIGIWPDMVERWVPADIEDLWRAFRALPAEKRGHFLRAGNAHMVARSMWLDQRTACAAFNVVACEALKPTGKRYEEMNIYDVVASLVGPAEAQKFRQRSNHPQRVRSKHLHRGDLSGGELSPMLVNNYFADPSFDQMLTELWHTTRICLVEWLRCGGQYKVVRLPRSKPSPAARGRARAVTKSRRKPRDTRH